MIANYTIRRANLDDSRFLYNLAMDPSVRENSTRSDVFSFEDHDIWYRTKLTSPLNRMWVLEADEIPVAQVRYGVVEQYVESDCRICLAAPALILAPTYRMTQEQCCKFRRATSAEIAISVSPMFRGKGYASTLLRETEGWAARDLEVKTLVALVVVGNVPSLILFRSAGYTEVGTEVRMSKRHIRFEKNV